MDVHHVEARADGGGNEPDNLITLCGAHHRAVHEGALVITGSVGSELAFWHADGSAYGAPPAVARLEVKTRVFQGLRALGFGERDAKQALAQAEQELPTDPEREPLLRYCIGLLTQHVVRAAHQA